MVYRYLSIEVYRRMASNLSHTSLVFCRVLRLNRCCAANHFFLSIESDDQWQVFESRFLSILFHMCLVIGVKQVPVQSSVVGVNFNKVNFQRVKVIRAYEKYSSGWKKTPEINFTTFELNFQHWKSTPGSIFNVKYDPRVNFSTGVNILR